MANYGAKSPLFAPFAGVEPTETEPEYAPGVTIAKLVSCGVTPNYAEGKLAADNMTAEYVKEIIDEDIALETDDLVLEKALTLYGAQMDGNDLKYTQADNAPLGGYAFYHTAMLNGQKLHIGHFYPKVRASRGARTFATKGDTITFGTSAISMKAMFTNMGTIEVESEPFANEADAYAWCASRVGVGTFHSIDVSVQGATAEKYVDHVGKVFLPAGEDFALNITGYADVSAAFDNAVDITADIASGTGTYTLTGVAEDHDIVIIF